MTTPIARHVAVLSLEPWDGVWRRNQHLVAQLLALGLVERVTFVEPLTRGRSTRSNPHPGVTAVTPRLRLPRRAGGLRLAAAELRAGPLRGIDLLWVNDAPLGRWVAGHGVRGFHDVTDDWRETVNTPRVRERLVAAEDWLALQVPTVVCSDVLAQRWHERYGVVANVVPNGVDLAGFRNARTLILDGPGPHVGYVGTLQAERLDVPLVVQLARAPGIGTVHLVGPDALDNTSRMVLDAAGVRRHGPVDHTEVPSWLISLDVLVCPHLVTPFTLSLDAIKAREYLAAGRPVVATPTSGFQALGGVGVQVVEPAALVQAVVGAAGGKATAAAAPTGWDARARHLASAVARTSTPLP